MSDSSSLRLPPGPRGVPLFGSTLEAWRDPIGLMTRALSEYGDVVRLKFGPLRYVVLNHPDAIRHVLVDNPANYTKSRNYEGLKLVLGQGLVTSEGDLWRRQRKLAQPAFHRERLAGFAEQMVSLTDGMCSRWAPRCPAEIDVHAEMTRLTFGIVGRTLFGVDVDRHSAEVAEAVGVVSLFAREYVERLITIPTWVPTLGNVRFRRAMRKLDSLVQRIIDARRLAGDKGDDLLGMLLGAESMTDDLLRDEVITTILAGHETTANALTWMWHLLASHPGTAQGMRDEIANVLGEREPQPSDLPRLELVTRVVQESLRLYPPAWSFERQATGDDTVMGFAIPAGTLVGICPYILHRSSAWWDDPERFDPDRFLPERSASRPRYAYLPFGGGPRTCIGASFAMMEAQIIAARVVRLFTFEPTRRRVDLELGVTLRPKTGLRMRVSLQKGPEPRAFTCNTGSHSARASRQTDQDSATPRAASRSAS
jgi:cytochrome P450